MYEKYITALKLMDDAIASKNTVEPVNGWLTEVNSLEDKIPHPSNALINSLMGYFHTEFAPPSDSDREEFKKRMHSEPCSEELVRLIPPIISEAVFPVYTVMVLLRVHRLPAVSKLIPNFDNFHNRYGKYIMGVTSHEL